MDPTFNTFPFGRAYTQLVWKSSTHLGCAWTPADCKFDGTSAFYLRCAFSPKGNVPGQFEDNVSCKGCPGQSQALENRQTTGTTGSPFSDYLYTEINYIRAKAGVSFVLWDQAAWVLAQTLTKKCGQQGQHGEIVGQAFTVAPALDQTRQTVETWESEPHTSDVAVSPNYAKIIDKAVTSFGCAWNADASCNGKWYMHCYFGNWAPAAPVSPPSQLEDRASQEEESEVQNSVHAISSRQSGDLNINMNDYSQILTSGINRLRNDGGQPDLKWSQSLVHRTHDQGASCSSFAGVSESGISTEPSS